LLFFIFFVLGLLLNLGGDGIKAFLEHSCDCATEVWVFAGGLWKTAIGTPCPPEASHFSISSGIF
jgi:hypothetical protein